MMRKAKDILLLLLRPKIPLILLLVPVSAAGLAVTFTTGRQESVFGCVIYVLSAYTLTALVIAMPSIITKCRALIHGNAYSSRFVSDIHFRIRATMLGSVAVNLGFGLFKLFAGILYSSFWFGAVAVYYIVLCIARLFLLRDLWRTGMREARKWRSYRTCGVWLFALNIALCGMVIQIVHSGKGYHYPGYLIYVIAAYAFYSMTTAIVSAVRMRRLNNPLLSASKALHLATALVALFSLQTAMFAAFDTDGGAVEAIMNPIIGGLVCLGIFIIAAFMIVRANRNLGQIMQQNKGGTCHGAS